MHRLPPDPFQPSRRILNRIRAITLDLDDTLWEIAPAIRRAEAELWRWLEEHCPTVAERFSAEGALELREQVIAEHADRCHDFRFVRRETLGRMLDACGYSHDHLDGAFAVFERFRNRVELFPDVQPTLAALAQHYRLIAVTNGNANLETIGIRHLFDDVVTAVDVGAAKPAPEIFDEAVRRAGCAHDEALHVGDHPECDVAGALGAGLAAAWVNRAGQAWPDHLPAPHAVVTGVGELRRLLQPAAFGYGTDSG